MMRGVILGLLILTGSLWARDEEPRSLIERAIKETGGEERLRSFHAVLTKLKGKVTYNGEQVPKDMIGEITADLYTTSDGKQRHNTKVTVLGTDIAVMHTFSGDQGWSVLDGEVKKMTDVDLKWMKASAHQERVTSLWPLLRDKGFTFTRVPEHKVLDRPAFGIRVSCKDKPDVNLSFDRQTGLLCKYQFKAPEMGGKGEEVENEITLTDYQQLDFARKAEQNLQKAGQGTSNKELLAHVKKNTQSPEVREKVRKWIVDLANDAFEVREKAGQELVALGIVAIPALKVAAMDKDVEVAQRAQACLKTIGDLDNSAILSAAIRLLGLRRVSEAAEALLALLPGADPRVGVEIRTALLGLAPGKGETNEALVKALEDKDSLKRSAARSVLGKDDGAWIKQPGREVFPTGLKVPHKMKIKFGTSQVAELEVIEVRYYNQFEEKVFARPE